jgi:hypothetical protein
LKSIIVSRGNVAHKWSETEKSCRRLYVSWRQGRQRLL